MDNIGYIYLLENKIDGNIYVGQTTRSIKNRIKDHIRNDYMIGRALRKYGLKNFKIIVYKLMHDDLDFFEQLFIKNLNTIKPNGYNLESGGHKNRYYSEESKRKMSEAAKKKVFTKKHRENMSKARKGNKNPNYGNYNSVSEYCRNGSIVCFSDTIFHWDASSWNGNSLYGCWFDLSERMDGMD